MAGTTATIDVKLSQSHDLINTATLVTTRLRARIGEQWRLQPRFDMRNAICASWSMLPSHASIPRGSALLRLDLQQRGADEHVEVDHQANGPSANSARRGKWSTAKSNTELFSIVRGQEVDLNAQTEKIGRNLMQ
jgi:hypothetical protein